MKIEMGYVLKNVRRGVEKVNVLNYFSTTMATETVMLDILFLLIIVNMALGKLEVICFVGLS